MEDVLKFVFQAFCETLEETNYRLQKELLEKQREVESLKKLLSEKQLHIDAIERRIRYVEILWGLGVSFHEGIFSMQSRAPALNVFLETIFPT